MAVGRSSVLWITGTLVIGSAAAAGVWHWPAADPPAPPADVVEPAPAAYERHPAERLRRYPPGRVRLPADTPVLGVSVGDDHPAYVLKTFEDVGDHVAADVVGGLAVRVTYCDRRGCAKAFAGDGLGDLRPAGFSPARGMLLAAGGRVYEQETGLPDDSTGGHPLAAVESARTTWGAWSAAHPDAAVACYPSLWQGAWLATYPARMADLPADAAVVGVSLGGRHRAYRLAGFDDLARYVVRDFVGDVPLAVVYCSETGRGWAFRSVDDNDAPRLTFAGWEADGGGLVVDRDGELYDAATGAAVGGGDPLPYPPVPLARTTWGEWRAAHPDTSVYVGVNREGVRVTPADGSTGWPLLLSAGGAGVAAVLLAGRRRLGLGQWRTA